MTKKLNKKGTSLVELIAVIVIMGVIAAIAVPVTVGVINRQKKKAAAADGDTIISILKSRAQEEAAKGGVIKVLGNAATKTYTIAYNTATPATPVAADAAIEMDSNKVMTGTVQVTLTVEGTAFTYTLTDLVIDGYTVTYDATAKACTVA